MVEKSQFVFATSKLHIPALSLGAVLILFYQLFSGDSFFPKQVKSCNKHIVCLKIKKAISYLVITSQISSPEYVHNDIELYLH